MNRLAAIAIPLLLGTGPLLAQTGASPAAAPSPALSVTKPSDLGCLLRMMDLFLLTRKASEEPSRSAEERKRSEALSQQANSAAMYYAGRIGPDFAKTNRAADGEAEFKTMRANARDVTAAEMALCMTTAEAGQRAIIQAMTPPKKN